jgi:hypothetical protein
MRRHSIAFALCLVGAFASPAHALDPTKAIRQYRHDS